MKNNISYFKMKRTMSEDQYSDLKKLVVESNVDSIIKFNKCLAKVVKLNWDEYDFFTSPLGLEFEELRANIKTLKEMQLEMGESLEGDFEDGSLEKINQDFNSILHGLLNKILSQYYLEYYNANETSLS